MFLQKIRKITQEFLLLLKLFKHFIFQLRKVRRRFVNPHHKSYHPLSLSDAWVDFSVWLKEVFLWITALKSDPRVIEDRFETLRSLRCFVPKTVDLSLPKVRWINHSTVYIETDGLSVLIDPIWSKRCTPVCGFGPKRKHSPGIAIEALGRVDVILISHNHYDHLDEKSIRRLYELYPLARYIVPLGCGEWFHRRGIHCVEEKSWWEWSLMPSPFGSMKITAVPAQHFSGRGLFDLNDTLWVGWVLEFFHEKRRVKSLYFSGDTGYNPIDFREIGKRFSPFDLSILPIGAYLPRKLMATIHINPYEAIQIHKEVQSKLTIACHHSTFALAAETLSQPAMDLCWAMKKLRISPQEFIVSRPGEFVNW